jgi:glutaredoxin
VKRTIVVAALAAWAITAADAQTNVYRWVDKDGKVQYSDTPPPKDARSSTQRTLGGGYPDTSQLPYATQMAMKKSPVTLFMSGDCGEPCDQGRALLGQRGIPFTQRNAQANKADAEALKQAAGQLQVPVLLVGSNTLKGFSEESWNAALDSAGYPRTRLPGQPVPQPQQSAEAPKPDTKQ